MISIRLLAGVIASVAATAIVVWFGLHERRPPETCPDGLERMGARCCGIGQSLVGGRCTGALRGCGADQRAIGTALAASCVVEHAKIQLAGGRLPPGAADWQRVSGDAELKVAPFAIDRGEVTAFRYAACVRAKACAALPAEPEPGVPVTGLDPAAAEAFCRFAGGRLPTSAEWRFAASGSDGRRFPWGFTGLVCRRSAFGMVAGPCSTEGTGPDLAGARPDGRTPDGIFDLSGNVAEWTKDPRGGYRARGGSFRSRVAAELVTAAVETPVRGATHVGFRCAY